MSESFSYENLIVGDQQRIVSMPATVKQGQNISRGQLLGRITASGKVTEIVGSHNDGSQIPYAIAAEDVNAMDGDKVTTVYVKGEFSSTAVLYSYGDDAADWKVACEAVGIYLRDTVPVAS